MALHSTVLLALAVLGISGSAVATEWTISTSESDPYVNSSAPIHGGRTLYLWFVPTSTDSMTAADIGIGLSGLGSHLDELLPIGDTEVNLGIFGRGPTFGHYLISVPTCVGQPVPIGRFDVLDIGVSVCLNAIIGVCREACGGSEYDDATIGFSTSGAPPCTTLGFGGCGPYPAVEPMSWGRTKAEYR